MSALANELLSFSRAGMQALDVKLVPVKLASTVARVLERETSPVTNVAVSVDAKLIALADPECLFRAVSNVVRNAVRYAGHAGPIEISAGRGADAVYLDVVDHGPGVPEDSLEQIFAPFYRVDPARSEETGGIGLGLAIVRTCVESCGGASGMDNEVSKGSCW